VLRVVVRHVKQNLCDRTTPVDGRLHQTFPRQRRQDPFDPGGHVRPQLLQLGLRAASARGELGLAIPDVRAPADDVLEIVPIRSSDVKHEVADGVRLLVGPPPEVVLSENVEAPGELFRILGEKLALDQPQYDSVKGVGHEWDDKLKYGPHTRVTVTPLRFQPRFTGGHIQTLYAWARSRTFPRLPQPVPRYFDVAPDVRVLGHCHWQDQPRDHPTLLLLHGLEGSSMAHYMGGMADKAWALGWNVVRLNQRNCGGTEHLSRGLYHSGLTHDPLFVIRELIETDRSRALAVAGYSLGGNLALKLAGDLGDAFPPELKAVCAVSPTLELAVCVTALERRANLAYQWNFVRRLKARMRRKAALLPGAFSLEPLRSIWTVRQFDEAYTAPHHGFRDAADYYHRASAIRVADRICVPAFILTAEDDPFVPVEPFRRPCIAGNPHLTTVVTRHGGHCAFVEHAAADYDGYWAEREVVRFVTAHLDGRSASGQAPDPSLPLRA